MIKIAIVSILLLVGCGSVDVPADAGTDASPDAADGGGSCEVAGKLYPCDSAVTHVDCAPCPVSCAVNGVVGVCR